MAVVQTFWRSHSKARVAPHPRHVLAHAPAPGTVAQVRQLLRRAADDALAAGFTRPVFVFEPGEVAAIYRRKDGEGGLWFALIDGRIYSSLGDFCGTDHGGYQ